MTCYTVEQIMKKTGYSREKAAVFLSIIEDGYCTPSFPAVTPADEKMEKEFKAVSDLFFALKHFHEEATLLYTVEEMGKFMAAEENDYCERLFRVARWADKEDLSCFVDFINCKSQYRQHRYNREQIKTAMKITQRHYYRYVANGNSIAVSETPFFSEQGFTKAQQMMERLVKRLGL